MTTTETTAESTDELGRFTIVTRTKNGDEVVGVTRRVVVPGHWEQGAWVPTDLSGEPSQIQAHAAVVWTEQAVDAYKSAFPAPEPPSLEEARAEGMKTVMEAIAQIEDGIIGKYSPGERAGFDAKLTEARAIDGGETDPAAYPLIAAEITITGRTAEETAAAIVAKAAVFQQASGLISGARQKAEVLIEEAETAEEAAAAAQTVAGELLAAVAQLG